MTGETEQIDTSKPVEVQVDAHASLEVKGISIDNRYRVVKRFGKEETPSKMVFLVQN